MSFKIVATRAPRGGTEISICPTGWEREGKLYWPPQNVSRLQTVATSVPAGDWVVYDCVVKKMNIMSFKDALYWENEFQRVDTEDELQLARPNRRPQHKQTLKEINVSNNAPDNMFEGIIYAPQPIQRPQRRETLKEISISNNSLDNMFEDINNATLHIQRPQPREILKENTISNNSLQLHNNIMFEGINNAAVKPVNVVRSCDNNNMGFEKLSTNLVTATNNHIMDLPIFQYDADLQIDISSRLDVIQAKLGTLQAEVSGLKEAFLDYRNQQHITNAKMLTMLDKISNDIFVRGNLKTDESRILQTEDFHSKYSLPVNDIEDLTNFDKDLNTNPDYFETMEQHFNRFIGTDGQGRGEVLGKQMAEQIMTRRLMTEMSWTGVSRTEGLEKKFAFQSLDTLFKLFYRVLLKADTRWSHQKNEKLFSGALLKHAKKRAIAETVRLESIKTSRKPKQTARAGAKGGPSGDGNAELKVSSEQRAEDGNAELKVSSEQRAEVPPGLSAENPSESSAEGSPEPSDEQPLELPAENPMEPLAEDPLPLAEVPAIQQEPIENEQPLI